MYDPTGWQYRPGGYPPYYAAASERRRQIRRSSNRVCWTALAGILLMYLFMQAGVLYLRLTGAAYNYSYSQFSGFQPVQYYLLEAVGYALGLSVPAFLYFSAEHIPLDAALPFSRAPAWEVTAYVLFGSMVCSLANYPADAVAQIQKSFGYSGTTPQSPLNDDPLVLILYGITVCVLPPFVEEIMFRGVILQSLRRYGDGFAVVVSALLFGLYHGNFIQLVFAFLCGLVMGLTVVRTNSLLPSMLIHFINNAVSFTLQMITRYQGAEAASQFYTVTAFAIVGLGIAALILLAVKRKPSQRGGTGDILPFSSRFGAMFSSPGAIVFVLVMLTQSVYNMVHL